MNIDIKLHKSDLPEDLDLGNIIAVDGEFMGLNVKKTVLYRGLGESANHISNFSYSKFLIWSAQAPARAQRPHAVRTQTTERSRPAARCHSSSATSL